MTRQRDWWKAGFPAAMFDAAQKESVLLSSPLFVFRLWEHHFVERFLHLQAVGCEVFGHQMAQRCSQAVCIPARAGAFVPIRDVRRRVAPADSSGEWTEVLSGFAFQPAELFSLPSQIPLVDESVVFAE